MTVNSVSTPVLQANTQYWVEVSAVDPTQTFGWFFNNQGASGLVGVSYDGGATYGGGVGPDTDPAFSLQGIPPGNVAPEPTSLVLLCVGVGSALVWRRFGKPTASQHPSLWRGAVARRAAALPPGPIPSPKWLTPWMKGIPHAPLVLRPDLAPAALATLARTTAARRPRFCRPECEQLEDRNLLSGVSGIWSAGPVAPRHDRHHDAAVRRYRHRAETGEYWFPPLPRRPRQLRQRLLGGAAAVVDEHPAPVFRLGRPAQRQPVRRGRRILHAPAALKTSPT